MIETGGVLCYSVASKQANLRWQLSAREDDVEMTKMVLALAVLIAISAAPSLPLAGEGTSSRSANESEATITIRSLKPGNIFLDGEAVSFMVTGENLPSGAELRAEAVDFDGKVAASAVRSRYGGGRAVADLSFGVQPRGYYRVRVKVVKDGRALSVAESSYAVVVSPEKRKYSESSPFAIDVAASWFFAKEKDLKTASDLVRLAGISCVRDRFRWSEVEPQKGRFRWGRYEKSARIQHEAGLTVYQIFHDCPTWASGKRDRRYPPKNPADMGDFFQKMVGHFKDRVKYWEIWNEPDIEVFYLGKPEQYAACLKESYRQIKEADPDAKVLICSFAHAPEKFAERVFKAGIADSFDIYNVHYYGNPIGVVHRLTRHKKLLEKYGVRKPIWVTEMGAVHPLEKKTDFETLRPEASYLVKAYVYGLANGAERFFYFIFSEFDERGRNFGTVNRDFTPRPAYVALCNLTYMLGEGKFVRKAGVRGQSVECYIFRDGEREVAVLWAREARDFRFPVKSLRAEEGVDVVGRPIPFRKYSDGTVEVRVGPEPVFFK